MDQSILGIATLFHVHAEIHVSKHDSLQGLLPAPVPLAGDDIVQGLQRGGLLAYCNELIGTLERIFGLGKCAPAPVVSGHGCCTMESRLLASWVSNTAVIGCP